MRAKDKMAVLDAIDELVREKGIDKDELLSRLEIGLMAAYKKDYNDEDNVKIFIDSKTGEVKIISTKVVVEDDIEYDNAIEIPLSEAKEIKKRIKVGSEIEVELNSDNFKRNAISRTKSIIIQYVREQEKENTLKKFRELENKLVNVKVKRIEENGNIAIDVNGLDATLSHKEIGPLDKFEKGEVISVYIKNIDESGKYPKINISRISDTFLMKLFEKEVPEIEKGIITIKNIARELGVKSKIAIYSEDKNIDLKGSCIGKDGTRINNILSELRGEKIELVEWNQDQRLFLKNALYPAEISSIEIIKNDNEIIGRVGVTEDQLTLAIGKKGINSKLAGKLCRLKVNIEPLVENSEEQDSDEIDN